MQVVIPMHIGDQEIDQVPISLVCIGDQEIDQVLVSLVLSNFMPWVSLAKRILTCLFQLRRPKFRP